MYRAERAIVVVSLVVMAIVVFLDVVHRSFSGEGSKLAMVLAKVAGWFGSEIVEGTPSYQGLVDASPWLLLVIFGGLAYFGIRSTKRAVPIAAPIAAGAAVAGVLVVYGLVRLLLVLLPNGLVWSQPMALVLTLWVGFVGASMCTYENRHLRVEAVQRFLPDKIRPAIGFLSGLLTTFVCFALVWVSLRYVRFNYQEYVSTEGQGGLFTGMDVPKYLGFSALPVAFGFMTIRFFVKALQALAGKIDEPIDPVLASGGVPAVEEPGGEGRRPSEVATEALLISGEGDKPSAVDTVTSKASGTVDPGALPSKIPTDSHPIMSDASGELESFDSDDEQEVSPDLIATRVIEEGPIPFVDQVSDDEARTAAAADDTSTDEEANQ